MLLLRREYHDGAEPPEIVLLHAEVTRHGSPAGPTAMDGLVPRQAGMPRVLGASASAILLRSISAICKRAILSYGGWRAA